MTNNEMEKACKNCHWFKPDKDYSQNKNYYAKQEKQALTTCQIAS